MTLPIPPKGKVNIVVAFHPVPHGWTFSGEIRALKRNGPPSLPPEIYPHALLWINMSQFLLSLDIDIVGAAERMTFERQQEDDGDDDDES